MVRRVGGLVGDKSCRVAVMEIEERHHMTDFLGQASAARQPITLDSYHNVISDVTICIQTFYLARLSLREVMAVSIVT